MTTSKKPRRMARPPQVSDGPEVAPYIVEAAETCPIAPVEKRVTKTSIVLDLLQQECGATLAAIVEVTGWLPHTARAALTGLRKKGHAIARSKVDGITRYVISPGAAE